MALGSGLSDSEGQKAFPHSTGTINVSTHEVLEGQNA